ncbi:MAG: hypothetical protein EU530_06970 [Promethearchaeota archaeon]|nr:MAG: hypothetical protein EU530_06970 [Candidatus Lokiarchaeota archaeon]
MTRIEKSQKVSASAETLFKVLEDYEGYSRWNPMILESEKNGKGYIFKTPDGEQLVQKLDRTPFLKVSHAYEDNPYIAETGETFRNCTECKDTTVTLYAIPKNGNTERCHKETEAKLKGLKHFAEFIEKGGNPNQYSKIQLL